MATKRISTRNIVGYSTVSQLKNFLDKIKDLCNINEDKINIKLGPEKILCYSLAGKDKNIHAFKSYILNKEDLFETDKGFKEEVTFLLKGGKKFEKNVRNFIDFEEGIDSKFVYNEDGYVEKILLKNPKLKLETAGILGVKSQDINIEQIQSAMNIDQANFSFKLHEKDFLKVKKMSQIENDNDIYTLTIKDNQVYMGETRWNLLVGETEYQNDRITFPKKFFNTINFNESDETMIYVFSTYLLILSENTNLMITIELHA
jgi:hypothetical protein